MESESVHSEESSLETEAKAGFIQRAVHSFKVALLGTLFVMAKDSTLSFKENLFGMIIDCLQMLAFPFNLGSLFPWNEAYSNWFMVLCFYSKLEFYISPTNATQNLIIYIICVLLVFFNLVNACIVGYRFVKKQIQNVLLLKILRSVTSLLTTVFYMPFLSQFMIMFSCAAGSLDFEGCPIDQKWLLLITAPLISMTFGIVSLIVAASFYEQDYTSDDVSARPHARIELFYLVLKGIITVVYSFFGTPEHQYLQIIMNLLVGFPVTFCYIYYLPFYHYTTTVLQAQFTAIFTWAGICLLFCRIQNNPEDAGPIALFYLGIPCVCVMVKHACDFRRRQLSTMKIQDIKSPYEVELKTRFWMLDRTGGYKTTNEEILTQAEDFYYMAERKFPNSSVLKLFVAQFHLTYRNREEAIPKLDQAEKRCPALDEQFIIYKTRQSVGKDAIVFVTFSSYLDSAHRAEIEALTALYTFWEQLKDAESLDFDKMTELSQVIMRNIDVANNYYKYLMNIDRTHRRMLPMYVNFLEDVMLCNDNDSKNLRNRVQDMLYNEEILRSNVSFNMGGEWPELTITLDRDTFGYVERVNSEMLQWLQLPKAKLINQSIFEIIPECLKESFEEFLRELKDQFSETCMLQDSEIYFLDKDGYLVASTAMMVMIVDDKKITDTSLVKTHVTPFRGTVFATSYQQPIDIIKKKILFKFQPTESMNPTIIVSRQFKVLEFSRQTLLMFSMNNDQTDIYDIRDLIPDFTKLLTATMRRPSIVVDYIETLKPVQTLIISKMNEIVRIKIICKVIATFLGKIYIAEIQKMPGYSRPTQKFFKGFIHFLEHYIKKDDPVLKNSTLKDLWVQDEQSEEITDVKNLLRNIKTQVESKNKSFPPGLYKVKIRFVLFMFLLISGYIVSYTFSTIFFTKYSDNLHYIEKLNNMQMLSLKISENAQFLDAIRRGLVLPYDKDFYGGEIQHSLDQLKDIMNELRFISDLNTLHVECIEFYNQEKYSFKNETTIDALSQQVSYSQKLVENDLSGWDIHNNFYAFWVYQNGIHGIASALVKITEDFTERNKEQSEFIAQLAAINGSALTWLCILNVLLTFPLLLKADETFKQIFMVFANIPGHLLRYLIASTENSLQMRQDSKYPDSRSRFKSKQEIWEENSFSSKEQNVQKELKNAHLGIFARLLRVCRQHLAKRMIFFLVVSLIFIIVLQSWYGQTFSLNLLSNSGAVIQNMGILSSTAKKANISAMSTILDNLAVPLPENYQHLGNQTTMAYISEVRSYTKMFLVGKKDTSLSFDYIYPVQVHHYFKHFFETTCAEISSCVDDKSVRLSFVQLVSYYTFETESICYQIAHSPDLLQRWNSIEAIANQVLKKNIELEAIAAEIEHQVIAYYQNIFATNAANRAVILAVFCTFCIFYYVFVLRISFLANAKREQLTRSMLLLMPDFVVIKSAKIQQSLININFE